MSIQNSPFTLLQKLTVAFFASIFLFNYPGPVVADESQPEVKTLRVNNYDMSYVERGSGEPLILVHGSLSDYRTWLPLLNELSETNHVIAVSLRHHYPEKWDGKSNNHSLRQHADDLAAFIQTSGIGPVNLLGHSRGGSVALLMASKHPELVLKLILADPSPLTTMLPKRTDIQAEAGIRKAKLHEVIKYYQHGDSESGLKVFVNYIAGPTAWENTSEARRNTLRSNSWTQISQVHDIDTPFTCNDANNISAPVLLLTGERSAALYGYMHSALQACQMQISNASISDAGHMMFQANPTAFVFEVQDFISP